MRKLEKLNFVVTGATSGIGRGLVLALLKQGANVACCGRSKAKLIDLENEIEQLDFKAKVFAAAFDMSDLLTVPKFINETISKFGSIDVLVNCAGANTSRDQVTNLKVEDLEFMLKINAQAPYLAMQQVVNCSMLSRKSGMIINVMSTVCSFSNENISAYTSSKSAFDGLSKVFRKEVREHNIKVCNIYPGGVDSPFREAERPLYLNPQQVVDAILFMAMQNEQASVDELTIRPMVEKNFT